MESTIDFADKVFTAQQKNYVQDENEIVISLVTVKLPI